MSISLGAHDPAETDLDLFCCRVQYRLGNIVCPTGWAKTNRRSGPSQVANSPRSQEWCDPLAVRFSENSELLHPGL
jgi:hypothetical protein